MEPLSYAIHMPDFSLTSHGARSRMLVIESFKGFSALAIAVLACRDTSTGSCVGLLLRRRRQKESSFKDPRYHVGVAVRARHPWMALRYRLAPVDWAPHVLSSGDTPITAQWKRLYISHRAPSRQLPPQPTATLSVPAFAFYCPKWLPVELRKQGFEAGGSLPASGRDVRKLDDRGDVARITFTHRDTGDVVRILIGQCGGSPWATARVVPAPQVPASDSIPEGAVLSQKPPLPATTATRAVFECGKNAVSSWINGTRTFGDARRSVQLTFVRAPDGASHLLDIRLSGSMYSRRVHRRFNGCTSNPSHPNAASHTLRRTFACLSSIRRA